MDIIVALEQLGPDVNKLQPLFITWTLSATRAPSWLIILKSFGSRILGLSGTQAQIDSVVRAYLVYVAQQESETGGDDYLVSHSAYVYLMNPQRKFVNVIQGSEDGEAIAAWLRK